jgi:hypothetical protein
MKETWTCHVCGDERPDARISVFSKTARLHGGVEVTQNVRYCNDRPACVEGAKLVDWMDGPAHYELTPPREND